MNDTILDEPIVNKPSNEILTSKTKRILIRFGILLALLSYGVGYLGLSNIANINLTGEVVNETLQFYLFTGLLIIPLLAIFLASQLAFISFKSTGYFERFHSLSAILLFGFEIIYLLWRIVHFITLQLK